MIHLRVKIRAAGTAEPPKTIPHMGRVGIPPAFSRNSDYPSSGLTPERLAAILRDADEGNVSAQMQLFEEMEEKDPHIASQLQTRKNAVTGLDWEIIPFGEEQLDKDVSAFVDVALSSVKNWQDTLFDLLDAVGKGIAISEIIWGYANGQVVPKEIIHIPQKLLLWDAKDELRLSTQDNITGMPLVPNKFIVHQYRARSGHPARAGVLRVCAWMYLFKNYSIKDWVAFAEVYGMPLRLGKYSAAASEDDKKALAMALIRLGSDAAGIIPDSADITFMEAQKQTSIDVFETLARYCDEQSSKAIVGQTLTADSGGGSYAQSKTHNEVRHDLTVADCKALAATLKEQLIRPLVLYNFGPFAASRLPTIHFACEIPENLKLLTEIYSSICSMGVPIPLGHIYSKFGIPEPQAGDKTTSRQAALPFALSNRKLVCKDDRRQRLDVAQQKVDQLVDYATANAADQFADSLWPLMKLLDECNDLDELQKRLNNPDEINRLLELMTAPQLQQLLADTMLAANLTGREREYG